MKHAILIIAYHHLDYVRRLVQSFDSDFRIFIHWDKKTRLDEDEKLSLESLPNVNYVGQVYPVNWASYGIVRATLLLCEEALKYEDVDYLHLISDADALVKDLDTFKRLFEKNSGMNYLHHQKWVMGDISQKPYSKIAFYHRLEKYNIRVNKEDGIIYRKELEQQKKGQEYRSLPDIPIYGGSAWWSLTRECVQYMVSQKDFVEHTYIDTQFPDESFAQTVIMNSPYATTVVNDDLRYICWETRNGSHPAILDMADFCSIINGVDLFARKIDPRISETLLVNIDNICRKDYMHDHIQKLAVEKIVEYLIQTFDKRVQRGLFYGYTGFLILLLAYQECIGNNGMYKEYIDRVLDHVQNEFESTKDESFETGKAGLAVGLEYIMPYCRDEIRDSVREIMDEMHDEILNNVMNFSHEDSEKELFPLYNMYFKARERNRNLTAIDRSAWKLFQSQMNNIPQKTNGSQCDMSIGLAGISGYGLVILSGRFGYDISSLEYIINSE